MKIEEIKILTVSFVWGIAEATFFFIPPDFFVFPAVLAKPKLWKQIAFSSLAGSVVGMGILSFLIFFYFAESKSFLLLLPFISEQMFIDSSALLKTSLFTALAQPFSGMPVKVWIAAAYETGLFSVLFFVFVIAARTFRMFLVGFIAKKLSPYLSSVILRHRRAALVLYILAVLLVLLIGIGL